jgi:hypothetical protein
MIDWKGRAANRVRQAVKVASDLADVAVHLGSATTPLAVASIGARAINSLIEVAEANPHSFFENWAVVPDAAALTIYLARLVETECAADSKGARAVLGNLAGVDVGWVIGETWANGPYCHRGEEEEAKRLLALTVWAAAGGAVRMVQALGGGTLVDDSISDTYPSQLATDLADRLGGFIDRGYHRSVLLYGVSGSGKSCAMRQVSQTLGKHTLRIDVRNLEALSDGNLPEIVHFLKPFAVLIDDVDRAKKPDDLLSDLERVRASVPLFMASANDVSKLDPAFLRPGRFDEVIELSHLGDDVFDRIVEGVDPEIAKRLRSLPTAYLSEFMRRFHVVGANKAVGELEDLQKRLAKIGGGK